MDGSGTPLPYIRELIDGADERWGDPHDNIGRVVPFGIAPVDRKMIGVPIERGGVFGIQGAPGSRKTTLVLNLIINQCLSGALPPGYHIEIDTLESGMTIERYADIAVAIVATKLLVYWHWHQCMDKDIRNLLKLGLPERATKLSQEAIITHVGSEINGRFVRETLLRPEFFQFALRTPRQKAAIDLAKAIVRNWPILIFGVSEHPNSEIAQKRTVDVADIDKSLARWRLLSERLNMRELVIDHIQEYRWSDKPSDYELQKRVVEPVAAWQKPTRGVAWVISQVGITSEREARQTSIKPHAQGGRVLEAESQVMWHLSYNEEDPWYFNLHRPIKSRIGMHPSIAIPIDPESGAMIGEAIEYRKLGKAMEGNNNR